MKSLFEVFAEYFLLGAKTAKKNWEDKDEN